MTYNGSNLARVGQTSAKGPAGDITLSSARNHVAYSLNPAVRPGHVGRPRWLAICRQIGNLGGIATK